MADLPPAAQSVLDAFNSVPYYPDENDEGMLAAALRAAADQVLAVQWEGRIEPDTTHMLGINWCCDALHAIAAELKTTTTETR